MKKTLFDYFSKKRKEPSKENESDTEGSGHSSVDIQANAMSLSTSDEIETTATFIDLHECLHFTRSADVDNGQTSEVRWFNAPSNLNTERTSILGATFATTDDESGPFFTDLNSRVPQLVQEKRFKNDPTKPTFFENKESPCQPHLKLYPETRFGSKLRRFKSSWYSEYKWLEYNEELDACFCFTCRVFFPNLTETTFTKTGFRDWKHAKEKGKGFNQHQSSNDHLKAVAICEERKMRNLRGQTVVASRVSLNSDHKQSWLFAVFNVSRYLCPNSLPFRGTNESDIGDGDGLFLRALSQLLFPLEEKWKKIHRNLPRNAKHTSPPW